MVEPQSRWRVTTLYRYPENVIFTSIRGYRGRSKDDSQSLEVTGIWRFRVHRSRRERKDPTTASGRQRFGFFREGETVASLALALALGDWPKRAERRACRGSFRGFCVALLLRFSSPDISFSTTFPLSYDDPLAVADGVRLTLPSGR